MKNVFATKQGIIGVGIVIGILAPLLQFWGNPANMGICVACFLRDITGALGLHQAPVVQYMRPEIIGFVLGSFAAAYLFKEFRPRLGSAPLVRFVLGFFAMIGALIFLGCPWRALLRLAGGDFNAILGLLGLGVGIWIGTLFLKTGYNLGASHKTYTSVGWIFPIIMLSFLILMFFNPQIPGEGKSGIINYSVEGPGSLHAPLIISLVAGLAIGFVAQRSRFCTMGAIRDLVLFKQTHLFMGIVSLAVTAFVVNLILGQFHPGFANQPVAHTMHIWNFSGMVLAGLAFALAGGCPGRQLFLSGEGDGDAAVFVIGMVVGAAFAHNFGLASSAAGVTSGGIIALFIGLAACLLIGFTMREAV
ncbi:YedE family putative selenium transporter [Dehalobacterium formicoaceticum]|uniref:YedE family putative selenium transporter n=1 Tax=Dehalobacterium formicoaceticum TaxID=51515 RepID=A0ABT1Y7S4_9FIRM|nr:YedE family putative selenium transporter [Dehalobacterium formicoaceticum]MCR6546936.1 YedE family putative selenium transporter [Dehalobacterium formicoaceticum]